jgi:hypothetical protein
VRWGSGCGDGVIPGAKEKQISACPRPPRCPPTPARPWFWCSSTRQCLGHRCAHLDRIQRPGDARQGRGPLADLPVPSRIAGHRPGPAVRSAGGDDSAPLGTSLGCLTQAEVTLLAAPMAARSPTTTTPQIHPCPIVSPVDLDLALHPGYTPESSAHAVQGSQVPPGWHFVAAAASRSARTEDNSSSPIL